MRFTSSVPYMCSAWLSVNVRGYIQPCCWKPACNDAFIQVLLPEPSVACGYFLVHRPHRARIRITPLELHFERKYDIIFTILAVLMIATQIWGVYAGRLKQPACGGKSKWPLRYNLGQGALV